MYKYAYILILLTLVSCSETKSDIRAKSIADSAQGMIPSVETMRDDNSETSEEAYATYFILVADTGLQYYPLRAQMLSLQHSLGLEIDTMGRGYNKAKDLIALPEDDEDEVYAGEYFMRRFPSATLSLEYLNVYYEPASEKAIAVVAGIYEQQRSADSALQIIKQSAPGAFTLKSRVYIGCMH